VRAVLVKHLERVVIMHFQNERSRVIVKSSNVLRAGWVVDRVRGGEVEQGDEWLVGDCAVVNLQRVRGAGDAAEAIEDGGNDGICVNVSDASTGGIGESDPFVEVCEVSGL